MTRRCNGNPAQYERNRRFRHLVHVHGWQANGAKLPSEVDGMVHPRNVHGPRRPALVQAR